MVDGKVKASLTQKLENALNPQRLMVVDESARHEGHAGAREGGETHFKVEIVSSAFQGLSRLERQRLVHRILADELDGPVHALSIQAHAPAEE